MTRCVLISLKKLEMYRNWFLFSGGSTFASLSPTTGPSPSATSMYLGMDWPQGFSPTLPSHSPHYLSKPLGDDLDGDILLGEQRTSSLSQLRLKARELQSSAISSDWHWQFWKKKKWDVYFTLVLEVCKKKKKFRAKHISSMCKMIFRKLTRDILYWMYKVKNWMDLSDLHIPSL